MVWEHVFKLGTAVYCSFTRITDESGGNPKSYNLNIQGTGAMYDSYEQFEEVTDRGFKFSWLQMGSFNGTITIGDGITTVASNFFGYPYTYNLNIDELIIGSSLANIGDRAFENMNWNYGSVGIKKITSSASNLYKIGANAFANNRELTMADFNGGGRYVSAGAFSDCRNVKFLFLSNEPEYYDSGAFSYCFRLERFNSSNKVEDCARNVFNGCCSLTVFQLGEKCVLGKCNPISDLSGLDKDTILYYNPDAKFKEKIWQSGAVSYYLITEVDSVNKEWIQDYDWEKNEVRALADKGLVILLKHLGSTVKINTYADGEIAINHDGTIRYLKVSKTQDANSSPLVVKSGKTLYYIQN